jgi:hypothetical protein
MSWINEVKKPKSAIVSSIKPAKSGKGYILTTKEYDIFLWGNSKIAVSMLAAVDKWVLTKSNVCIEVVPDVSFKDGFKLDVKPNKATPEFYWSKVGDGYFYGAMTPSEEVDPFAEYLAF